MKVICTHKGPPETTSKQCLDAVAKIQVGDILTVVHDSWYYEFAEYPDIPWYKKYFSPIPDVAIEVEQEKLEECHK